MAVPDRLAVARPAQRVRQVAGVWEHDRMCLAYEVCSLEFETQRHTPRVCGRPTQTSTTCSVGAASFREDGERRARVSRRSQCLVQDADFMASIRCNRLPSLTGRNQAPREWFCTSPRGARMCDGTAQERFLP